MSVRCLSEAVRGLVRSHSDLSPRLSRSRFLSQSFTHRSFREIACLAALALPIGLAACGGGDGSRPVDVPNSAPRVTRFLLTEPRAHAAEDLHVSITAVDDDGDELRYRWFATRGSFPLGRGQRSVVWRSPRTRGIDTLSVMITDFQDSILAHKVIELVLPEPPGDPTHVNSTSLVDISWEPSPDEDIENWVGYQVFYGTSSLAGVSDQDLDQYLATPVPVRDHLVRISGLDPGRRYYFHTRGVRRYDGALERSPATSEFHMAPRPEGPVSGFGEFSSSLSSSFDLSAGVVRPLDVSDASGMAQRDFYIGTVDAFDQGGGLVLKSVSELANRNPAWGDRVVQIKRIGVDNWTVATTDDEGWSTKADLTQLGVYALKTPEGNFAKVWITGVSRFPPERIITFIWAYQTIPNYPSF